MTKQSPGHIKLLPDTAIQATIEDMQLADKSDPFIAARVKTHLINGVGTYFDRETPWIEKSCYTASFKEDKRLTATGSEYKVIVPVSVTRA